MKSVNLVVSLCMISFAYHEGIVLHIGIDVLVAAISLVEHVEAQNPSKGIKNKLMYKNPRMARTTCEFCGYKSSKEGVARHKQRRHPKNHYFCDVCHAKFGVK